MKHLLLRLYWRIESYLSHLTRQNIDLSVFSSVEEQKKVNSCLHHYERIKPSYLYGCPLHKVDYKCERCGTYRR